MTDIFVGYTGQRCSGVSGGYLLGNGYRGFNPVLKQFTEQDDMSPFGAGGEHGFSYCGENPVNRADPSGHMFGFWRRTLRRNVRRAVRTTVSAVVDDATETGTWQEPVFTKMTGSAIGAGAGTSGVDFSGIEALFEGHALREPISSFTALEQAIAPDELINSLELSHTETGRYKMRSLATGELSDPHGPYLFAIRIDEPGIVRTARNGTIAGHTSLTQNSGVIGYHPVEVYYAGMLYFDNGSLRKWNNDSGHYQPAKEKHLSNMIPWVHRLLPDHLFEGW